MSGGAGEDMPADAAIGRDPSAVRRTHGDAASRGQPAADGAVAPAPAGADAASPGGTPADGASADAARDTPTGAPPSAPPGAPSQGDRDRPVKALRGKTSVPRLLLAFGVALILPTLIALGVLLAGAADGEQRRIEREARLAATASANDVGAKFNAAHTLTDFLAGTLAARSLSAEQFLPRAVEARRETGNDVILISRAGRVIVATGMPLDPVALASVLANRANRAFTGLDGIDAVGVMSPVMREGELVGHVVALIPGAGIRTALSNSIEQDFVAAALVSDQRRIVIRTRDQTRFAGATISRELALALPERSGNWQGVSHEGVPIVGGFAFVPGLEWLVAVGIDQRAYFRPLERGAIQLALTALVLLALSLAVGWVVARRILVPVRQLTEAAGAMGRGEGHGVGPFGIAELDTVAAALERSHAELARRDAERDAAQDRLRQSEERLRQMNAGLEAEVELRSAEAARALQKLHEGQRLESIGQLTSGVAHDFNNLLSAASNALFLLRKNHLHDPEALRLADNAIAATDRGRTLTQRLLTFARQQDLDARAVDLGRLVADLEPLLTPSLGPTFRLERQLRPDIVPALVDAGQLELAVLNLVVNARDAMPEGGTITIAVDEAEPAPGATDLAPGRYVRLTVRDQGRGMDAQTLARAHEPFFTTKGVGKGTGLGLSMVHGLCAQSGGAMRIASAAGRGTTVELWLPPAPDSAHPLEPVRPAQVEPATRALDVLAVDDDALVMMGTEGMLEDLGHRVIVARSADEALAVLAAGTAVDVVVTDHSMPGMTGAALARHLRETRPDLPVILATGYAEIPALEGLEVARLAKPFSQDALARALAAACSRASNP